MKFLVNMIVLVVRFLSVNKMQISQAKDVEVNKSFTIAAKVHIYSDPCDIYSVKGKIPANTKIQVSKEIFVFSGIAGFPWYFVKHNNMEGWISSQVLKNAPKIGN